jgi:hypothetical protein
VIDQDAAGEPTGLRNMGAADLLSIDPDDIPDARVLMTVLGGASAHASRLHGPALARGTARRLARGTARRLARGTARGTALRIVPAQPVQSVR